jgi:hypothetical protein
VPAPRTGDPIRRGLSSRMPSPAAVEVDGADAEHDPIAMTLGVDTDASPYAHLTSGTSVPIHGGMVASGCMPLTACITNTSFAAHPFPACSAMDASTVASPDNPMANLTPLSLELGATPDDDC